MFVSITPPSKGEVPSEPQARRGEIDRLGFAMCGREEGSGRSFWTSCRAAAGCCALSRVQDYLGEKIGLYFAMLGHYTAWLGPYSFVGLIMFADQLIEFELDALLSPYFCIFVSFWAVRPPQGGKHTRAGA